MTQYKMASVLTNQESIHFGQPPEINSVQDYGSQRTLYKDISIEDYNPSNTTPVFYGSFPRRIQDIVITDNEHLVNSDYLTKSKSSDFVMDCLQDPSIVHPATFGYVMLKKKPVIEKEKYLKPLPDREKCSPREFLENYIFPLLLPALEEMLVEAKKNKVFEKRRTKFNACDFLTMYLYRHNSKHKDRNDDICLKDIPFVREILAVNPRPPIPLSLLLSDDEAATIIQSYYRGYQVRKDPEVHELREYQKEMREEEVDITFRVENFWRKHSMEHVE